MQSLPASHFVGAVPEKGWKRLSSWALASPEDASGKPQQDPAQKRRAALLRPPCSSHRSTSHGELSGAAGLVPPPAVVIIYYKNPYEPQPGGSSGRHVPSTDPR